MPEQQPNRTPKRSAVKKGLSTFTKAMLAILVVLAIAMAAFVFNAWQQLNRINAMDDPGASEPGIEVLKPSEEIMPTVNNAPAMPAEPAAASEHDTTADNTPAAPAHTDNKADTGTPVLPTNTNNATADNTPAPQPQAPAQGKKNGNNLDNLF